jgi:RNA-binding protein
MKRTMTELTGAAKRQLRQAGKALPAKATVGKEGLTEGVTANVSDLLARHELVKVKLPAGARRKRVASELAEAIDAELITVVGRTGLLYRPNEQLPAGERIVLL